VLVCGLDLGGSWPSNSGCLRCHSWCAIWPASAFNQTTGQIKADHYLSSSSSRPRFINSARGTGISGFQTLWIWLFNAARSSAPNFCASSSSILQRTGCFTSLNFASNTLLCPLSEVACNLRGRDHGERLFSSPQQHRTACSSKAGDERMLRTQNQRVVFCKRRLHKASPSTLPREIKC